MGRRGDSWSGPGRGRSVAGWTQPVVVALLIFSAFLFFFFQVASLIPRSTAPVWKGPGRFPWSSDATRNLSIYLRPDQQTTLLQPNALCSDAPYVLFVIPSAVNNTQERDAIRKTWGQWAGTWGEGKRVNWEYGIGGSDMKRRSTTYTLQTSPTKTFKLVFFLGTAKGRERVSSRVWKESQLFGDLVVEDFVDSYTNLTLKTVFMLKWVNQNCPSAQYIMKADDDIFVNVPNLHRTLSSLSPPKVLTGSLICGARPIYDPRSKWYTPHYMFREGHYPNYLSGTGYVLSGDLVDPLFSAALSIPYFHLEDVFLTGICARKVGVRPTDNFGFSYQPRALSPCVYKEIVMGHEVTPSEMLKLWHLLNRPAAVAKCRPIKKSKLKSQVPTKCVWR